MSVHSGVVLVCLCPPLTSALMAVDLGVSGDSWPWLASLFSPPGVTHLRSWQGLGALNKTKLSGLLLSLTTPES